MIGELKLGDGSVFNAMIEAFPDELDDAELCDIGLRAVEGFDDLRDQRVAALATALSMIVEVSYYPDCIRVWESKSPMPVAQVQFAARKHPVMIQPSAAPEHPISRAISAIHSARRDPLRFIQDTE